MNSAEGIGIGIGIGNGSPGKAGGAAIFPRSLPEVPHDISGAMPGSVPAAEIVEWNGLLEALGLAPPAPAALAQLMGEPGKDGAAAVSVNVDRRAQDRQVAAAHGVKSKASTAGSEKESSSLPPVAGTLANMPVEAPVSVPPQAPPSGPRPARPDGPWSAPDSADRGPVRGPAADVHPMPGPSLAGVQSNDETGVGTSAAFGAAANGGEPSLATTGPDRGTIHLPPAAESPNETVAPAQTVASASSLAASKDTTQELPNSLRPADPGARTTATSGLARGARILNPAPEQARRTGGPNVAAEATSIGSRWAGIEPVPLNAPPLREIGGVAGGGERQAALAPDAALGRNDPFAALDAERAAPPGAWVHADAHHAEAGYLDPALGWISVRAEAAGSGGVHAALVPASSEAAQVLGSHLAGLNAYLSEHHGEPAIVTMASPHDGRDATGTGAGSHAGYGDTTPQEDARSGEGPSHRQALSIAGTSIRESGATPSRAAAYVPARGGTYISVMA